MILITGANGYVGVHLTERLCRDGAFVRALVRRGCCEDEKRFLAAMGAEVHEADVEERGRLMLALEGVDTVVHLLGSIERPRHGGYERMHTHKTRLVLESFKAVAPASRYAAFRGGVRRRGRVVYLSALGASQSAGNRYGATKWEAEEAIRESGFEHVVVRSSLVFGRETGRRDSKIVRRIQGLAVSGRVLPLVGGGHNRLQPIYIRDLVTCLVGAILDMQALGETWDVGGPEVLKLRDVAGIIMRTMGIVRPIVAIPYPAAYLMGAFARLLRREGRLNFEQIRMSRHDIICGDNRAPALCGGDMISFADGMKRTVSRFKAPSARRRGVAA